MLGVTVLIAGSGWLALDWSPVLSAFDIVVAAIAGAVFGELVRSPLGATAAG